MADNQSTTVTKNSLLPLDLSKINESSGYIPSSDDSSSSQGNIGDTPSLVQASVESRRPLSSRVRRAFSFKGRDAGSPCSRSSSLRQSVSLRNALRSSSEDDFGSSSKVGVSSSTGSIPSESKRRVSVLNTHRSKSSPTVSPRQESTRFTPRGLHRTFTPRSGRRNSLFQSLNNLEISYENPSIVEILKSIRKAQEAVSRKNLSILDLSILSIIEKLYDANRHFDVIDELTDLLSSDAKTQAALGIILDYEICTTIAFDRMLEQESSINNKRTKYECSEIIFKQLQSEILWMLHKVYSVSALRSMFKTPVKQERFKEGLTRVYESPNFCEDSECKTEISESKLEESEEPSDNIALKVERFQEYTDELMHSFEVLYGYEEGSPREIAQALLKEASDLNLLEGRTYDAFLRSILDQLISLKIDGSQIVPLLDFYKDSKRKEFMLLTVDAQFSFLGIYSSKNSYSPDQLLRTIDVLMGNPWVSLSRLQEEIIALVEQLVKDEHKGDAAKVAERVWSVLDNDAQELIRTFLINNKAEDNSFLESDTDLSDVSEHRDAD